jgi:hypothetical protein
MAKKPEPPKPVRWGIYKLAAKQTWVGEVEAPDEAAKLLKDFDRNGGKTRGDQGERALARISSGRGGMSWQPGTFSRAPR